MRSFLAGIQWKRHQIWIYYITHFRRAGRVAYAILDVVIQKWLATLVGLLEHLDRFFPIVTP